MIFRLIQSVFFALTDLIMLAHLTPQERQTVRYYEKSAAQWTEQRQIKTFWGHELQLFYRYVPTGKLLDLGSGSGRDAHFLLKHGYGYRGIDLSRNFLSISREAAVGATFLRASIYNIPFPDRSFDCFWATAIFLHIPKNRLSRVLKECTRVLKPGAIGYISMKEGTGEAIEAGTGRFFTYYQIDEFLPILAQHGFTILEHFTHVEDGQPNKKIPGFQYLFATIKKFKNYRLTLTLRKAVGLFSRGGQPL